MLTPKENLFECIHWGKPEYMPLFFESYDFLGRAATELSEKPTVCSGRDPFGVYWHLTNEGAIPDNREFLLDDIADWERVVKFPDVSAMNLKAAAETELAHADRKQKAVAINNSNGLFERTIALMGFENTLCALMEDPDSCRHFYEALTDYKVKLLNAMIDAYSPDVVIYFDDLATANGLFMSPETYRSVFKPFHKRIAEAVAARGVVFSQHICGKCEALLEDFVEIGATVWNSAQPMNDLNGIMDRFQGRLVVEGGWDTSGPCSFNDSTEEQVREEVRRNIREYKRPSGGFILAPVLLNERGNSLSVGDPRLAPLEDEWRKYRML